MQVNMSKLWIFAPKSCSFAWIFAPKFVRCESIWSRFEFSRQNQASLLFEVNKFEFSRLIVCWSSIKVNFEFSRQNYAALFSSKQFIKFAPKLVNLIVTKVKFWIFAQLRNFQFSNNFVKIPQCVKFCMQSKSLIDTHELNRHTRKKGANLPKYLQSYF